MSFAFFSLGLILGVVPAIIWGRVGGDEHIIKKHPNMHNFLHIIHHWQIGIAIVLITVLLHPPYSELPLGFGTSLALDDLLFHSFEERKNVNRWC